MLTETLILTLVTELGKIAIQGMEDRGLLQSAKTVEEIAARARLQLDLENKMRARARELVKEAMNHEKN